MQKQRYEVLAATVSECDKELALNILKMAFDRFYKLEMDEHQA